MRRILVAPLIAASSMLAPAHALRVAASRGASALHVSSALRPPLIASSRLRGGASYYQMTAAVEAPAEAQEKFRKDYAPPPYRIDSLSLNFDIYEEETLVTSTLSILPHTEAAAASPPMELDGEELELKSIEINGAALSEGTDYLLTSDGLSLLSPPASADGFELKTVVSIAPHKNTQLSGLYKSSGMYVTQCEAEGFRRITYFQDRPDIMATYDVRIEAEKAKYPLLLSNGNEVRARARERRPSHPPAHPTPRAQP